MVDLPISGRTNADTAIRARVTAAISAAPAPADAVRAIAASIAEGIRSPGFRGCAFLNAVAEYPDAGHPVHQAVLAHRQWFLDEIRTLMTAIEKTRAEPAAQHFVMLRDGAMAAGCLFDPAKICETFLRGVEGLVEIHGSRQPS
jgi:hypothetical protein